MDNRIGRFQSKNGTVVSDIHFQTHIGIVFFYCLNKLMYAFAHGNGIRIRLLQHLHRNRVLAIYTSDFLNFFLCILHISHVPQAYLPTGWRRGDNEVP